MKKEIDCYVWPSVIDGYLSHDRDSIGCFMEGNDRMLKAKLIIDTPERKINISESEFDEAWKWPFEFNNENERLKRILKNKLFGEDK